MSKSDENKATDAPADTTPAEKTNAFRAGYMAGYTADNPNSDPSVAGYMDGYFVQREGNKQAGDE